MFGLWLEAELCFDGVPLPMERASRRAVASGIFVLYAGTPRV